MVEEDIENTAPDSWHSYQRLVLRELKALTKGQDDLSKKAEAAMDKTEEHDKRLTKLETWRDLMFWAVPFGVTLAGFIIGVLKFAGV